MGPIRAAAREVVSTLRGEPIMAEDFGAQPHSPQVACLTGLRQSDLVVLILGEQYGAIQPSGFSATHEEYREARARKDAECPRCRTVGAAETIVAGCSKTNRVVNALVAAV
jgi:hypothetical protein